MISKSPRRFEIASLADSYVIYVEEDSTDPCPVGTIAGFCLNITWIVLTFTWFVQSKNLIVVLITRFVLNMKKMFLPISVFVLIDILFSVLDWAWKLHHWHN